MQAFAQMRLREASAELTLFSALLKQETNKIGTSWISRTAVAAAESMLEACPSVYERHCLLQLLSAVDFCDSGAATLKFKRYSWKLQLVEPCLCIGKETVADGPNLGITLQIIHPLSISDTEQILTSIVFVILVKCLKCLSRN